MDEVTAVNFYIVGNFPDYGNAENMIAMLDGGWDGTEGLKTILAGIGLPATIQRNGKRDVAYPWKSFASTSTPDGLEIDFTHFSTLEPAALAKRHSGIKDIAMHYGAWPNSVNEVLRRSARLFCENKMTSGKAWRDIFASSIPAPETGPAVHFWATAEGKKNGKACLCNVYSTEAWATNANMISTTTGILALAAERLVSQSNLKTGLVSIADVFAPDEVFRFFSNSTEVNISVEFSQ